MEVYSADAFVALYVNGRKVGKKKVGKDKIARFRCIYRSGSVTAVAFDEAGRETGRTALRTAGEETLLKVVPEKTEGEAGELCFVSLRLTDRDGVLKPLARTDIALRVEGGDLLAFGNACPYNEEGYLKNTSGTYFGRALAVIRLTGENGAKISASCAFGSARAEIKRKAGQ